jgi:DNA-binding NarL/FixJ family response regulator
VCNISLGSNNLKNELLCRIALAHGEKSDSWGGAMTRTPRVLLADDQEEIRQTIALMLRDDFDIVGTAEDGTRAVDLTTRLSPDVLVLDISMPMVNGIEVACRLKELGSHARVVFLTVHTDPDFVEAALSAGALGYVSKPSVATDLVPAIWAVIHGNTFVSPLIRLH